MSRAVLLVLLLLMLVPGQAWAHQGGEPLVLVPVDHVLRGESFPLTGADLGPDAVVTFRLEQEGRVLPLGKVNARPDGHLETTFVMPSTVPDGYTELVASSSDGSKASVWILVGERTEATPPPPGERTWGRRTTVIVLALVLVLSGAVLALLALASGRRRARSR